MALAPADLLAGSSARDGPEPFPDPLPVVRRTVRALLQASPSFRQMEPREQRRLAQAMVRVGHTAALLIRDEAESEQALRDVLAAARPEVLATAQSAGSEFSGTSAARVAGLTHQILNAVSFPRFVSELITGVFKAIVDSSMQQMNSYLELLNGVAASIDGFEGSAVGDDRARAWLAERYPGSFEVSGAGEDGDPEEASSSQLRLRPGASVPAAETLRTDLGLGPDESVPGGDPERSLVPFARRRLAKSRQEMLATMVMLGMQRIVIESGRINASMRFHIDTRSAAQDDRGSTFDLRNQINASGSFGIGAWGASASVQNNIAYVSTQRTQTTEEMNTDLELNSSVEVVFKSDYLPLNRLASPEQVDRIRQNTRNPEAEAAAASADRQQRARLAAESDAERRRGLDQRLTVTPAAPPAAGAPGTAEDAERRRREDAERRRREAASHPGQSGEQGRGGGGSAAPPPTRGGAAPPAQTGGAAAPPAQTGTTTPPQSSGASPAASGPAAPPAAPPAR